jgi:hypothetical protein
MCLQVGFTIVILWMERSSTIPISRLSCLKVVTVITFSGKMHNYIDAALPAGDAKNPLEMSSDELEQLAAELLKDGARGSAGSFAQKSRGSKVGLGPK